MPDIQQYSVTIKFKTEGSEKASNDAKKVKDSVDGLKGSGKSAQAVTMAFSKLGGAVTTTIGAIASFVSAGKLKQLGEKMLNLSKQTADYIETVNLFRSSMGAAGKDASEFRDRAERELGLDPRAIMDSISAFQNLSEGIGISNDRAYIMSKNLTQLAGDLSSFANISFEQAQKKLLSGFSGQVKPLREYGIALDQASLQETAYSLGLDQKVKNMTRAQKTELIYYQIMKSTQKMQGDLGRTLLSPANALRVMQTEYKRLSRAVGSIFIPMMMKIIPVVRAVTQVLTSAAEAIANLLGFKMENYEADLSSVGNLLNGVGGDIDDVGDSAKGTAKELNKMLMPFDELNNLTSGSDSGGSGGAGGAGVGGGSLGIELPEYDMFASLGDNALGGIKTMLSTLFEPMQNSWNTHGEAVIESVKHAFEGIYKLVESIGKSFATVWTNGTGEQILNTFWETLTAIFNIIGNIGETWAKVWSKDNTGTTAIQNIADGFKNVFEVVKGYFETIQEFTKSKDFERFSESLVSIFKNISEWGAKIGEEFKRMWDSGLKNYFEKTMEFTSKIWELIKIVAENLTPTIKWVIETIGSTASYIYGILGNVMEMFSGSLDIVIGLLTGDFSRALDGAKTVLKGFLKFMLDTVVVGIVKGIEIMVNGIIAGLNTTIKGINIVAEKFGLHLDEITTITWSDDVKKQMDKLVDNMFEGTEEANETVAQGAEQLNETTAQAGIDAINNFNNGVQQGSWVTNRLLADIHNKVQTGLDQSQQSNQWGTSTMQNYANGISSKQNSIITPINNTKSIIQSYLGRSDSYRWGQDMIQGYVNGIQSLKYKLETTGGIVARTIAKYIHFSRPDVGPLREYETWMPDMIEGLSNTLLQSMPTLNNALAHLSGEIANSINEKGIAQAYDSIASGQNGVVGDIRSRATVSSKGQGADVLAQATYSAMSRALENSGDNSQPQQIVVNIGNREAYRGYGTYKNEQSNMLGVNVN